MTNTHRTVEVPLVLPVSGSSGGRGLGNFSHLRVQFGEDVIARYRGGGPEVELVVVVPGDYSVEVNKHMTPAQAFALAQRLLSAVEATSHTPGSHPMETKPVVDQEVYEDATAISTVLLNLDELDYRSGAGAKKIRMIKAVRQMDFGDDYGSRDARLLAVLKLWGITSGYDDRGLRLAKLVVDSWQDRLAEVRRGES